MIRRFIGYYKPHLKLFIADMVAAMLLSVCDLFYPMITRRMLNDYIPNEKLRLLVTWAAILLLIYFAKAGLNYFMQYYGHIVGVRMQSDMRREAFEHLEQLPFRYFDNNKTGSIMSRIINDLQDISELAHHGPENLILAVLLLITSFILMASINIWLTLIIFAFLPFLVWFAAKKRLDLSATSKEARVSIAETNATLENNISGIRVSKAFTSEDHAIENFKENDTGFVIAKKKQYKAMAIFHAGNTMIVDILNVVVFVAGGIFTYMKWIEFADFASFIIFVNIFLSPIKNLINFIEQLQSGMTGFERFCEIMDTPIEEDAPDAVEIHDAKGDISFHDVSFSYDENNRNVLSNLTFDIKHGQTVAFVGPSGSGKTTICHVIPRFYDILGGKITLDGYDTATLTRKSLRQSIGIVTQDVFLFTGTIKDNIAYGCPGVSDEAIVEAAKRANIHDFIAGLPDGYDTFVGERGVKLSGGQKQRISIARVFLKNPPILILDEATSALDNATELLIQRSLDELCRGRTTIVVAHRLSTIKNADQILVITDHGIAESGNHKKLLEKGGLYAELYRVQFAGIEEAGV